MNSLLNYGSDDDYEEAIEEKRSASTTGNDRTLLLPHDSQAQSTSTDANYDEVQMDLSEDSNGSTKNEPQQTSSRRQSDKYSRNDRRENPKRKHYDDENRHYHKDTKSREREDKDKDRNRDRYRDRRDRSREDKHKEDKFKEERRRRSRSRSRSPSRKDYRRCSRTPDRNNKQGHSRRYDRSSNKLAQLEKLGIEIKSPDESCIDTKKQVETGEKDRFYMPGITGRFKDQIERRKMLWQKKDPVKVPDQPMPASSAAPSANRTGKVWEATTFAQDQDGKVASKFKRLMGIRDPTGEASKNPTDVLKKQEEMFHSMEQQYEVARTATHTMRGVGLGFGSYQR